MQKREQGGGGFKVSEFMIFSDLFKFPLNYILQEGMCAHMK